MRRIHRSTSIIVAILAAVLILLNIPGNRRLMADPEVWPLTQIFNISLVERYQHGWPFTYLERHTSELPCGFVPEPVSAWNIAQAVQWFRAPMLVANVVIACLICAAVGTLWELRRRRRPSMWQITIVDLLASTMFIAAMCGLAVFQHDAVRREIAAVGELQQAAEPAGLGTMSHASSTTGENIWPSAFTELVFQDPPPALTRIAEVTVYHEEDLRQLPKFQHLKSVHLWTPVANADLQQLAACRNLRVLNWNYSLLLQFDLMMDDGGTQAQTIEIPNFPRLEQLCLSSPNYDGAGLEHLPHLKVLHLATCNIDDEDMLHIGRMRNLVYLNLEATKVTDVGLKHVAKLQQLQVLSSSAQTTDEGVGHLARLSHLRNLHLGKSRVTDQAISTLELIPTLTSIDLRDTAVTSEGLGRLSVALPDCVVYHHSTNNHVGGFGDSFGEETVPLSGALSDSQRDDKQPLTHFRAMLRGEEIHEDSPPAAIDTVKTE